MVSPTIPPASRTASSPSAELFIELRAVTRSYDAGGRTVQALQGVDLDIPQGEFFVIVGRSGCGKSTLLNLLGGLDKPSGGEVRVGGRDVGTMNDATLTQYRRNSVGIIFQFFNLMPLLTVLENTALPALLAGRNRRDTEQRARLLLERVGLEHRIDQQASLLSGGEMQRVAVARSLINDPPLILADEPTGNLDSTSAEAVLGALRELAQDSAKTVVMVTHSREAAAAGSRIHEMRDGKFLD
jgi:putative ABC transport system ATP-binding protein